jgi:hypothetical protein
VARDSTGPVTAKCNSVRRSSSLKVVFVRPLDRPNISAALNARDVFDAQQQSAIKHLSIPVYLATLANASTI